MAAATRTAGPTLIIASRTCSCIAVTTVISDDPSAPTAPFTCDRRSTLRSSRATSLANAAIAAVSATAAMFKI